MPADDDSTVLIRQSAIALFRRWYGSEARWLVVREPNQDSPRLIEAERLEQESFRESLDRELSWQLRLRRSRDYLISSTARLHFPVPWTYSITRCSGEQERIMDIVEFYLVELFGSQGRATLDATPTVQWWTARQLMSTESTQDRPLLPRKRELLIAADILSGSL